MKKSRLLKHLNLYSKIKIVIYFTGLCLTVFLVYKVGLVHSHTPPPGFVVALLFVLISSVWLILDWFLVKIFKLNEITFYENYFAFILNVLIVIAILFF